MKRASLPCLLALLVACTSSTPEPPPVPPPTPQHVPQGSTTGGPVTFPPSGTGRLDGDLSFAVVSTHVIATSLADGGGIGWVQVRLGDLFAACQDEGSVNQRVLASFGRPGGPVVTEGAYSVDAGTASITLENRYIPSSVQALEGDVRCNYAGPEGFVGSLTATLGLPDGGTSQLTGYFVAPACGG